MCMVSAIFDYGRSIDPNAWTQPAFEQFKQIVDRTQKLDEQLGEPDCEDPGKAAWMKEIEERLTALEAAQFRAK